MLDHVNYDVLDAAKNRFVAASRQTLSFAEQFGYVANKELGASANIFALDLSSLASKQKLYMSLLPEGLGTADDARPSDLTEEEETEFWYNIALKTLSCLTNDAASAGLQTILVGLYLPSSEPEVVFHSRFMDGFLEGFVEGCRQVGCVYLSGETPQLKSKILPGKLDVAGSLVGIAPSGKVVDSNRLQAGNKIVFIQSSGPHENGFTSLRKLAESLPNGYRSKLPSGQEYWKAINTPGVLYTPLIQAMLNEDIPITNIEPITGHGWQKLMRVSKTFCYRIDQCLEYPELFSYIEKQSGISRREMLKIFNCGVGLAVFVEDEDAAKAVIEHAAKFDLKAIVAGEVEAAEKRSVKVLPWGEELLDDEFQLAK